MLVVALLAAGCVWYAVLQERRGDLLTFAALDIGQGDALFVEAPNGAQMLLDGGPNATVLQKLSAVMPFYDRTIDVLVVTNPDKDHIGGFLDVLKRYEVAMVVEPGTITKTQTYAALDKAIREEGSKRVIARRGMSIVLDPDRAISLDIIFPDRDVSTFTTNDGSIVARLVYASTSVMLTGDTTARTEKYLVRLSAENSAGATSTPLKSTILKIAHHGSKTSSTPEFVAAVAPELAVISLGHGNMYHHPNTETLDTLAAAKVPVRRTDKEGTIVLKSDGRRFFRP